MKIVVVGGTGLIGAKIVDILRWRGEEVVAASPRGGIDAVSGEGLAAAFAGAPVVIDVSNSPSPDAAMEYFEASSHNLLVAGAAAGVGHHVALSIVGVDRVPGQGYYRAKLAQEALIQASGIPYTIVRATQFMEFLGAIADGSTDKGVVRLPQGLLQPVAAGDVAAFVAEIAVGDPRNGIVEMAGPERAPFGEIVGRYLKAIGDKRDVLSDPEARYFGGKLEETSLVPLGAAHLGGVDLNDWVRRLPGRL